MAAMPDASHRRIASVDDTHTALRTILYTRSVDRGRLHGRFPSHSFRQCEPIV